MDLTVRIAGEAGQGVQTTGNLLVEAFAAIGFHVFATQSYMSRIRGGVNWFDVRIGDAPLYSGTEGADVLVALHGDALETLRGEVTEGAVVLFDGDGGPGVASVPLTATAKELSGSAQMANTVAAGAVFALLGCDVDELCDHLGERFARKGEEVVAHNVACARRGAELAGSVSATLAAPRAAGGPRSIYSGTEAVGLAAAVAGVKLVTSYPMTPSTGVFTFLAGVADDYGIVVEQAEDELAAINMVCGATYGGVPAMTTTSGGGFALMCEGLSLAGMMELPAVVLLSQRPGPATGLPTRTGQEDLGFALHAGHGEFPRALFAPGTPEQAYALTRRAFETAHRFQTPAIVLIDQFLADLQQTGPALDAAARPIDRHVVTEPAADYARYALSPDGVSPRALPGSQAFVVCDSDEHTEDGHITEDLGARLRLQDKRLAKARAMAAEALPPERYGPDDAETLLVAWGSTYGPCREAIDQLAADGRSVAMAHFAQVWPLDAEALRPLLADGGRRVVSVEGNATGQLAAALREAGALRDCELMLRYDGMPFTGEEIARRVPR